MIKNRRIYRKAALERLTSPEQLDRVLKVTNPRNWASLLAVYVVLGAVIIWGSVAELPVVVRGMGVVAGCGRAPGVAENVKCSAASNSPESTKTAAAYPELLVYVPVLDSSALRDGISVQFRPFDSSW